MFSFFKKLSLSKKCSRDDLTWCLVRTVSWLSAHREESASPLRIISIHQYRGRSARS